VLLVRSLLIADIVRDRHVKPARAQVAGQSAMGVVIEVEADRETLDRHYSSNSFGKVSQV
jgi:hypothetical protein